MTAQTMEPISGVCRYCGCTEESPCYLSYGDTCSWLTRDRTVCTSPACIKAWTMRPPVSMRRKRTPAEIHELIRQKKRGSRKRGAA